MADMKRNRYEQYKRIVRFLIGVVILSLEMVAYWYVWVNYYNQHMEVPYNRTGHWLMVAVYGLLLVIFNIIYGGWRVGYMRTRNMIYSQTLAGLCANFMIYLQITLLTKHFLNVGPLLAMTAVQFVVICIWSTISTRLYRILYPPRRVLLIYGEHPAASLMGKMSTRNDRFVVGEAIHISADADWNAVEQADAAGVENPVRAAVGMENTAETTNEANGRNAICWTERIGSADVSRTSSENMDKTSSGRARAELEDIKKKIDQYEGVVICDIPSHIRNLLLKYCYGKSVRTYTTPKISDILLRSAEKLHLFDTPLLLSRNVGLTFDQRFVKRLMDIILSLAALVILSPVFIVTAVAIKVYDGGPVFFRQDRCTKDGKVFSICKFRSMIVDAEKEGHSIPATDKDPRITPVGRIIRSTRIDELPQILNILKGDMSIVGPRPERVEHVELYTKEIPEFPYRMKVKGGLTGYAQVYGKYNTTAYDKLKLDLMYIQNYSVMLDIEIILQTIKVLFMKESTEGFGEEMSASIAQESAAHEI